MTILEGGRLDVLLADAAEITRSRAASLIKDGLVTVNGTVQKKPGFETKCGDALEWVIPEPESSEIEAQDIPLRIVYQDADLAVVYKPAGMVVHPAAGNHDGTMVNALLYAIPDLSGIGGEIRPGIVHRIDKDTSGLLLVAKNDAAHVSLAEQIKEHSLDRAYKAVVIGTFKQPEGYVEGNIGRHHTDRKKMAIVPEGKPAHTDYTVLTELNKCSLIECRLTTGRTHQIRVHMASIGHPVLGDPIYGPKKSPFPVEGGQLLHAYKLGFTHPRTGERMLFTADPEERFLRWVKKLTLT